MPCSQRQVNFVSASLWERRDGFWGSNTRFRREDQLLVWLKQILSYSFVSEGFVAPFLFILSIFIFIFLFKSFETSNKIIKPLFIYPLSLSLSLLIFIISIFKLLRQSRKVFLGWQTRIINKTSGHPVFEIRP